MVTSTCYVHDVDGSHVCLEVLIVSTMMMMMMRDDDDDDDDDDGKAVQVMFTNSPIAILPLGYELPAQPSPKDTCTLPSSVETPLCNSSALEVPMIIRAVATDSSSSSMGRAITSVSMSSLKSS